MAGSAPEITPRVVRLVGARLLPSEGAVVTADGCLVVESLLDTEHLNRQFGSPKWVRRPRRLNGTFSSILSAWSENYYHWIIDCLPRFALLEAVGLDGSPVIVPRRLSRFQRESLEMVGIPRSRMAGVADEHCQLLPDELVWASPAAPVNFPTPFVANWLRRALGAAPTPGGRSRLVVSRSGSRRIANEDELVSQLEPMGFRRFRPDDLSVLEQARAFAEAEVIVGAHGAALTNMVFAEHLSVLELFPPQHVAWHYYTLARGAGHDYWYAVGRPSRRGGSEGHDFEVDIELVKRTIEAMTSA